MSAQPTFPLVAVTGSQRPYIFDLPQLLSLPDGLEFRFRYRREWVSDDISTELASQLTADPKKTSLGDFAGEELILVFHSQERRCLIPVRRCTIIACEFLGPIIFVRFRVGPLVRVPATVVANESDRSSELLRLDEMGKRILNLSQADLSKPLPERSYLRRSAIDVDQALWASEPEGRIADDVTTWAALAALLQQEPGLNRVPLFRLMGFQRKDGTFLKAEEISNSFTVSKGKTKGFMLIEGERYRLRLLEWCETIRGGAPGALVSATLPSNLITLEGSSNLVVGKYDVLEFSCMVQKKGYGELAIRVDPPAALKRAEPSDRESATTSYALPAAEELWPYFFIARVPIQVRRNRLRLTFLVLVGAMGMWLYLYPWVPAPLIATKFAIPREVWQFAGLMMVYISLGEYLQQFVKFSGEMKDVPIGVGRPQIP